MTCQTAKAVKDLFPEGCTKRFLAYTLVALAGIGFTWFLHYWNLLTFGVSGILN